MKKVFLTCLFLLVLAKAFSQSSPKAYDLVISNANMVDVVRGKLLKNQLVAISRDTIQVIAPSRKIKKYKADRYLDAGGRFLMPGLWDMHVHFRGGNTLINENKALLPLFLAYGITTVRDAGGDLTPAVMEWRRQIAAGTLAGPRIFTSGPKIDGPQAAWAGSLQVQTPAQVKAAIDSLQSLQADYVKIYDSKISREAYLETIREAEKRGLKTSGHLPFTVKLSEAAAAGLDAVEHMYYVLIASSAKEDSIFQAVQQSYQAGKPLGLWPVVAASLKTYSPDKAKKVFQTLKAHQTAVVPTLFVSRTIFELSHTDHSRDSLLAYISPKIQETYLGRWKSAQRASAEQIQLQKQVGQKFMSLAADMQAAGVTVLAGSDSGPSNSFVYPGQALIEELKLLVAAGLHPAQALQAATINSARFMGADKFYGSLQTGKCADILVLNSNPLADIQALGQIHALITRQRIYPKKELQQMLQKLRQ